MSKIKNIQIKVMPWQGNDDGIGRTWGESAVIDAGYNTDQSDEENEARAKRIGLPYCKPGLCVLIYPNYNDEGLSFHEWRSFNGGEFMLVKFGVRL